MAKRISEERKSLYIAQLRNCPTSPRKMRLVADLVRGMDVAKASAVLQFTKKHAARDLEKLLRSAISNFEQKTGERWEEADLMIKEISVDGGRMLEANSACTTGSGVPSAKAFKSRHNDS